jgi:hypothetical protein
MTSALMFTATAALYSSPFTLHLLNDFRTDVHGNSRSLLFTFYSSPPQ